MKIFLSIIMQLFLCTASVFSSQIDNAKIKYNIIIICLDTLRADHLGCYGYFRDTSPNIDKLASEGVLFKNAFAQSSFTLPSHASLFTSKYVSSHKVDRIERRLGNNEVTLAKVLAANGFNTAAFIYNATQLDPKFGLNQGFDSYSFGEEEDRRLSFEKTLPACLAWLNQHRGERFFIFLHSNDIHEPYHSIYENFFDPDYKGRLDKEYMSSGAASFHKNNLNRAPAEIRHIIAHYDGGIKYADMFIGKLMHQLEAWGLVDKTIIIVLSDHGEILADRGKQFCHGFSVHDEEVHVPLIIRHPHINNKGVRITNQVQLIDVMPTVLDFAGVQRENMNLQGKSLVNLITGADKGELNPYVYAECLKGESERNGIINREVMVRSPSHKLIGNIWMVKENLKKSPAKTIQLHNYSIISLEETDNYELYDLENDSKERKNIFKQGSPEDKARLLNELISIF